MTTTVDDNLNDLVRDAHAMEQQAEKRLSAQAERLDTTRTCARAAAVRDGQGVKCGYAGRVKGAGVEPAQRTNPSESALSFSAR